MTYEDNDKIFKITFQHCNGFVRCSVKSGEQLYIHFIHDGMFNLGLYPGDIATENIYFQWPGRTKTQRIYQRLLKEGNDNHK